MSSQPSYSDQRTLCLSFSKFTCFTYDQLGGGIDFNYGVKPENIWIAQQLGLLLSLLLPRFDPCKAHSPATIVGSMWASSLACTKINKYKNKKNVVFTLDQHKEDCVPAKQSKKVPSKRSTHSV